VEGGRAADELIAARQDHGPAAGVEDAARIAPGRRVGQRAGGRDQKAVRVERHAAGDNGASAPVEVAADHQAAGKTLRTAAGNVRAVVDGRQAADADVVVIRVQVAEGVDEVAVEPQRAGTQPQQTSRVDEAVERLVGRIE